MLGEKSYAAAAVAKRDQVFAENFHSDRRTVRFRYFPREKGGYPIMAHQLPERSPGICACDQLIFFP